MADAFWEPIFARLIEDREAIAEIVRDTPDPVLIGLARKNPALWRACQPFVKGRTVTQPDRFHETILDFAGREAPLRRVVFFEWVNANPRTLAFPAIPITSETPARLESGEFGPPAKISILSRIDPRESAAPVLKAHLERCRERMAAPPAAEPGPSASADELRELRGEIRKLRQTLKAAEEREASLQGNLSERGRRMAELERELAELTAHDAALARRLEQALAELRTKGAPSPEPKSAADLPDLSTLRDSLTELENRNRELEAALARRTASGERLEQELEKTRRDRTETGELARRIEHLRGTQLELERQLELSRNALPARLLALAPGSTGSGATVWIAEAPGVGKLVIDESHTRSFAPVEGEWILLHRDITGAVHGASPLEASWKREVIGVLRHDERGWHLAVEETRELFPVGQSPQGFAPGDVVTAVILPELAERKTFAVPLRRQPLPPMPHEPDGPAEHRISIAALQRRLGLIALSPQAFAHWLREQHIPFLLESDAFRFEQPVKGLIPSLRPRLPMIPVCEREACREAASNRPFPREGHPDEVCGICHEEVTGSVADVLSEERYDFEGRRILIVGGDAVGSAYRDVLARHRLDVEWMSGFVGLGGAMQGFGGVSAVVVILKQISHTLLRELTIALRGSRIPLLFATKRGTSGVLRLLVEQFRPGRPTPR